MHICFINIFSIQKPLNIIIIFVFFSNLFLFDYRTFLLKHIVETLAMEDQIKKNHQGLTRVHLTL